jgi:carbonic anhydrase/acetyltransferase-like protein (isoleucine patch superfamily)
VLRGDLNNITIGSVSNIQDRTVIHAARCGRGAVPGGAQLPEPRAGTGCWRGSPQQRPAGPCTLPNRPPARPPPRPPPRRTSPTGLTAATLVGKYVTVEPQCVLRSCRVEDHCIVGAKSVLCEGSMMEPYSILAPGSVLPPARRVPEGELWAGSPAKFVRKLTKDEVGRALLGRRGGRGVCCRARGGAGCVCQLSGGLGAHRAAAAPLRQCRCLACRGFWRSSASTASGPAA